MGVRICVGRLNQKHYDRLVPIVKQLLDNVKIYVPNNAFWYLYIVRIWEKWLERFILFVIWRSLIN